MATMLITLSLLLSAPTTPVPAQDQGCGNDCIEALTVALEWGIGALSRYNTHGDPERIALDIEPRQYRGRPPDVIHPDEVVAALHHIAADLGVEVVRMSEDEAWKICREDLTGPACRPHWGRTWISIGSLHFSSADGADVIVRVDVLGDSWLGGTGGPYYFSVSTGLQLEKTSNGWENTKKGIIIIS